MSKLIHINRRPINTSRKELISKKQAFYTSINWRNRVIYFFIFLIFAFVYTYSFDTKISLNGDNASYYLLGKSINAFQGYSLYNDLGGKPHSHFPPGYPLIIGFLMFVSKSPLFLKIANGAMFLGSLILSYRVFAKFKIPWQVALVSVLFLCVNYHLAKSSTVIMSEIPFVFFSMLCLWFLMKVDFSINFLKDKNYYIFLVLLSFSFHIRTAGIALFAGIIFYLLLERKWKGMIFTFFGFFLLALPWILRSKIMGLSNSYQNQLIKINPYRPELGDIGLMELLLRIKNNFIRYVNLEIPVAVFPFMEVNYKISPTYLDWIVGSLTILLISYGIYKLPKYRSLIFGYLIGSCCILLLWVDIWKGVRFILPLIPILMFLLVYSLSIIIRYLLSLMNFKTKYASFLLLPFLSFYVQEYQVQKDKDWISHPLTKLKLESEMKLSPAWGNYKKLADYAKTYLKDTDVIACRKPQLFHIFSDRYTCLYPFEQDDKKLLETLKKRKVTYVIAEQLGYSSTGKYLVPAVNNNPRNFRKIKHLKNPDTYLLQFYPPK